MSEVQFPTYASANTALAALQTDQLHWAGNFIPGVQQVFVSGHSDHQVWFPPVQTNSLEPNLTKFPTNQLAVRKAISLAIDRTALSQQAEGGTRAAGVQRQRADAADLPAVPVAVGGEPDARRRTRTSPPPSRCWSRPAT